MKRAIAAVGLLAASCAPTEAPPAPVTTTTPSTTAPTTTTVPPHTHPPTRPARRARVAPEGAERAVVAGGPDDAFWRRLADCECPSGRCGGAHVSYFQFSRDTAAKLGIDGSEPYEEQRAVAQEWARRIHPREGTSAGWPHCWDVAS